MSIKVYPNGKDQEDKPCIEVNGEIHTHFDILKALIKKLIEKGIITKSELLEGL